MVQSLVSRIKAVALVSVALVTVAAGATFALGVPPVSAQTPRAIAHSGTIAPQDCSFNGVSTTVGPPPVLGILPTAAGDLVRVSCHNMNLAGAAVLALAQASPLVLATQCNGAKCASVGDFESAFGNEVDLSKVQCQVFPSSSMTTWNPTYQVPAPYKSGGTACGGFLSEPGDASGNATCPPTQQEVNVGLLGCAMAVISASTSGSAGASIWGLVLNKYTSPVNPLPKPPTLQLGSTSVAAGGTVSVGDKSCTPSTTSACPYWWGDPVSTAPFAGGAVGGTLSFDLPAINVFWQFCPATTPNCSSPAVEDNTTSPSVTVTPAVYNMNTSTNTGSFTSYPKLSGSIPVPATLAAGSYVVNMFEDNALGMDPGNSKDPNLPKAIEASAQLNVTKTLAPIVTKVSPVAGPEAGGTTATITGQNLTSATVTTPTIKFGSTDATSVTCTSSTTCTATSPAGQGAVDVTATVGSLAGVANPPGDVFTYLAPPGVYTPVVPTRICDTRPKNPSGLSGPDAQCNGTSNAGETLKEHGLLGVQVGGLGPSGSTVPSNATAAVLNVTVADTTRPGYLTVFPDGSVQPTTSNLNWAAGKNVPNLVEVALPSNGKVDFFNGSTGTADVLVDLAGYVAPAASGSTAGYFNPLSPSRICDTRAGNPSKLSGAAAQCTGKTISAGKTLQVSLANKVGGLPASGIGAVVVNVTVANPKKPGYLTVFPTGATMPTASNVNFSGGETVPNRVIVKVGKDSSSNPSISIYASAGAGSVDVMVDVNGWFTDGSQKTAEGQTFTAVSPERVCDTRTGNPSGLSGTALTQCEGKILTAGGDLPIQVASLGAVPAMGGTGAPTAVVLNVTVITPTTGGYATAWPEGQSQPTASDLNWTPGDNVANMVVVELGTQGGITIFNSRGLTNLAADVVGWYS